MAAFLNWDRDEHFAVDHGLSGIARKTVEYHDGTADIGFAQYPAGELFCQFLNYDPAEFFALKRQRDGRKPAAGEELAAVLCRMPYYRDLMAQLPAERRVYCAQQFSQFQRGGLWQDAELCLQVVEKRYRKIADLILSTVESGKPALCVLAALPTEALNSPALGEALRTPIPCPAPRYTSAGTKTEPVLAEQYRLTQLLELVYVDFIHFLQSGGTLQRCRNCGRYFLPERGYNYRYCTRLAPGESDRTCRDIGAAKARQSKLEDSAVLAAYQRIYKRFYARVIRGQWTKEDFRQWQSRAITLRDRALRENWPADRFEAEMKEG